MMRMDLCNGSLMTEAVVVRDVSGVDEEMGKKEQKNLGYGQNEPRNLVVVDFEG